jgi:hypothetical protein
MWLGFKSGRVMRGDCPGVEATRTAAAIAGLRWRLRSQKVLQRPKVLSELHKLEEQVAEQLGYADGNPGAIAWMLAAR